MASTKLEYPPDKTSLGLSVLLEVFTLLGAYRDSIALVGGWVPFLLAPEAEPRHVGSLDVDIAIDFERINDDTYTTMRTLLEKHGYRQVQDYPYRFARTVTDADGKESSVSVDLLAGEYGGTGRSHRSQRVQDVRAHKARGCDLVFNCMLPVTVSGRMPKGATNEVTINIAGIVPFLAMKGNALSGRLSAKDAYDIWFVVSEYPGGSTAIAEAFRPFGANKLVREGLMKIRAKFTSVDALGPVSVAEFLEEADPDERARIRRDAYETVNSLLDTLGVEPHSPTTQQEIPHAPRVR